MQVVILSGNPKKDGLCQKMIEAVEAGVLEAGAKCREIRLNDLDLVRCQVCDSGWGPCRESRTCRFGADGFTSLMQDLGQADAIVFATPVYWGEMSETLKCFLDRLRRCQRGSDGSLAGRQALILATPGGSGRGQVSCFMQMDQFCRHTEMAIFDYLCANRWTLDYQLENARAAGKALASGRKNGDTVKV